MYRSLVCIPALFALALPCRADDAESAKETLVRLHVSPAAAPNPVLKHTLLPELKDSTPGNAVHAYLVCFMEQQKFFFDKEELARREELATMPLDKLPVQELQNYGGSALRQADWAARLDQADWQILLKLKAEGISLLIPDVQQMRLLARALRVRFRGEVAQHRFDDALRTAQTMFGMSRHLGEHLTFIGNLVGIAVASQATGPLEEMINEPGCPNLYWALTYLPSPLVPLDRGAQGERIWIEPTFRPLDDTAPLSAAQLDGLNARFEGLDNLPEGTLRGWLDARVKNEAVVAAARARLVESGIAEERLKGFPAEQVLLLDEKRACQARHDDVIKLVHLPAWQADKLAAEIDSQAPILFDLAPAIAKVHWAQARLDQRIALLRHVEALRLYAAEHGTLPAKLSEISVPLPLDPLCGQPFRYEVNGATAHLRGTPPKREENNPAFNLHYEVTLRK
ncbi:MAG TPA: hypothetical protein VG125_15430 [Pirellulales bacterium]|jgi:hypothetical protein|nr:hypothetical protein [Pirellulales bacterium]